MAVLYSHMEKRADFFFEGVALGLPGIWVRSGGFTHAWRPPKCVLSRRFSAQPRVCRPASHRQRCTRARNPVSVRR